MLIADNLTISKEIVYIYENTDMEPIKIKNKWKWGYAVTIIAEGCGIVAVDFNEGYEWGYINSLTVHQSRRRQGIGTRLMEEAEKVIKEEGFDEAQLRVEKEHTFQKEWYERLGYKTIVTEEAYYKMRKIF